MSNSPISQRIVCAANRRRNTGELVLGARHFDVLMHHHISLIDQKYVDSAVYVEFEQGFIDQRGSFLSRTKAWKVAEAANQIIRRVGGDTANGGTLYSENLY